MCVCRKEEVEITQSTVRIDLLHWKFFTCFLFFSFQNSDYLLQTLTSQLAAAPPPALDMFYGLLEIAKNRGTDRKAELY